MFSLNTGRILIAVLNTILKPDKMYSLTQTAIYDSICASTFMFRVVIFTQSKLIFCAHLCVLFQETFWINWTR